MDKYKIISILRDNISFIKNKYGISKIGIFGSYSKNTQTDNSDIDLIIKFEKPIGLKYFELIDFLEEKLGKNVDVITEKGLEQIRIKSVSDSIRNEITYV
ncbi:nucleotidyltransferase family protein [Geotoga petraea]|uniref:Polymerase nucleotidyl transferase domain-containing protein n=1 Tax=Geotoga petraea TaxID=28234 RepID=A0A1G6JDH4_9BACT|nr:nucleotidyltransferase family protein [Geotoga petraea]SDC15966.1 hypothetical protein SAMN04488588_0476 [Geotoga petraea]